MTTNELPNCPVCGAVMLVKEARATGRKFYGCSTWKAGNAKNCSGMRPFKFEKTEIARIDAPTNVIGSVEQVAIWNEIKNGNKHLIVEAVAGSGKTFTIVHVLTLLPITLKVLFLAFNRHIAEELKSRVPEGTIASTLHSYGLSVVKKAYPKAKVDGYKLNTLIDRMVPKSDNKEEESINQFLRAAVEKIVRMVKANLADISSDAALDAIVENYSIDTNDRTNEIYTLARTAYKYSVNDTKSIDFDDMIFFPTYHNLSADEFDLVIGDEIQDWNKAQQALVMRIVRNNRFIGVGDRFQSIYGFAGADVNSIPNMIETLKNTSRGYNTLPLTETRRCPINITAMAQDIVPHIKAMQNAIAGNIETRNTSELVKLMVAGNMGIARRNAPLVKLAYGLLREGKCVQIKGRDFGKGIISLITKLNAKNLPNLIERAEAYRAKEADKLIAKGKKGEQQLDALNDRIDTLIAMTEDMDSVDSVIRKINNLFSDTNQANAILLSSVHRAKGLEGDDVFIIDYDKIEIPMKKEDNIQQERNLHYVAITRSKKNLTLAMSDGK